MPGAKLRIEDFNRIRYFQPSELGRWWELDRDLLFHVDRFRAYLGVPLVVTSAARNVEENRDAEGAPLSQHLIGRALDLAPRGVNIFMAYLAAERFGFGGIGVYFPENVIHLDNRAAVPGARWGRINGRTVPLGDFWAALGYRPSEELSDSREWAQKAGFGPAGVAAGALVAIAALWGLLKK